MRTTRIIYTLFMTFLIVSCNSSGNKGEFEKFDMKNAASPAHNLMTGGQPSLDDLKLLAETGTKIVINLRTKGEFKQFNEKLEVEKLGMLYVSIEVAGSDGITFDNAKLLDEALNNSELPALVHCASSNRVGGLLAYRSFKFQNYSSQDALAFGQSAGMSSTEKKVKRLLNTEAK